MPHFHVWTIGCQMNKAESTSIAGYLERFGYEETTDHREADLIVLNTCSVRQHAEQRVLGNLGYLKGIKKERPSLSILVTGCMVGPRVEELEKQFPHVDLFFKPGAYVDLVRWAGERGVAVEPRGIRAQDSGPTAFVPIIQGCNNFCSYCIVPYRRGREKSRPVAEVICEVSNLANRGVKEVTLLGQNVNSYGHDLPEHQDLGDLLAELSRIPDIHRLRFLTNHPKDMSRKLVASIAGLGKVCKHINLPLQAGDDQILKAMRRGYTSAFFLGLVDMLRQSISGIALSTDVIVGFPGESDIQFGQTLSVIRQVRFDTVHVAAYSPRPQTFSARKMEDDVPAAVKEERLQEVEALQTSIATELNARLAGSVVEVLVEGKDKGKWYGRTGSNKLVFFVGGGHYPGKIVRIRIEKTGPWSLQGTTVEA